MSILDSLRKSRQALGVAAKNNKAQKTADGIIERATLPTVVGASRKPPVTTLENAIGYTLGRGQGTIPSSNPLRDVLQLKIDEAGNSDDVRTMSLVIESIGRVLAGDKYLQLKHARTEELVTMGSFKCSAKEIREATENRAVFQQLVSRMLMHFAAEHKKAFDERREKSTEACVRRRGGSARRVHLPGANAT